MPFLLSLERLLWMGVPYRTKHYLTSTTCMLRMTLRSEGRSTQATPCLIVPQRGMVTTCTSDPGGCSSRKPRPWGRSSSPIIIKSSFRVWIQTSEVRLKPLIEVEWEKLIAFRIPIVVAHGTELRLIFGPIKDFSEWAFANTLRDFYIRFVNDLDPGGTFVGFNHYSFIF